MIEDGAKKLANELEKVRKDETMLDILSRLLNYKPKQLARDIKALYERVFSKEGEQK